MKRLQVSQSPPQALRATEASFEKEVVEAITAVRGHRPPKTDGIRGWPDRYIGRGVWIEFKSVIMGEYARPYQMLEIHQKAILKELHALGDDPYVCILWLDAKTHTEYVQFARWGNFTEESYNKFKPNDFIVRHDVMTRPAFMEYVRQWAANVGT